MTRGVNNSGILPLAYFTTYSVEEYAASLSADAGDKGDEGDAEEVIVDHSRFFKLNFS